jgi:hypothetical protein
MDLTHCNANIWGATIALLWFLNSLLEYWLGKTEKVKAGSMLELTFSAIIILTTIVIRRFYGKSNSTNGSA